MKTPRPTALPVLDINIPAELKAKAQWVLWRYVWKASLKKPWTKPPFQPCGKHADTTDPSTYSTFDAVMAAYRSGGWDGIGYVHLPEDKLTGLDADKCRDPDTGTLSGDDAAALLAFDTYTEASPSGTGIRAYAFGTKPGRESKSGDFEMYDGTTKAYKPGGRFLTLTGHRLPNSSATIQERQSVIKATYYRYWPTGRKKAAAPTTSTIKRTENEDERLRRMFSCQKNGNKIRALFDGDTSGYKSPSEADQALANHLAWWFNKDSDAIDRVFRTSKLMREKWGREDYRTSTIGNAVASISGDGYDPDYGRKNAPKILLSGKSHDGDAKLPVTGKSAVTADSKCDVTSNSKNDTVSDSASQDEPKTGARIILDYFRGRYRPDYRRANSIHTADGELVPMSVAVAVPTSALIKQLESATDAPRFKGGGLNNGALPAFFNTWGKVAWGDLLAELPDEDSAKLGKDSPAAEEFRRLVRDVMLTTLTLGDVITRNGTTQTERRALADWCVKFAKSGPWRSIRSYRCWCKNDVDEKGLTLTRVAIRAELFAQLPGTDKRLRAMGQNTFTRLAERYGVGTSTRADRPHGKIAVVLSDEFLADLVHPIDDATEEFGSFEKAKSPRVVWPSSTDTTKDVTECTV